MAKRKSFPQRQALRPRPGTQKLARRRSPRIKGVKAEKASLPKVGPLRKMGRKASRYNFPVDYDYGDEGY